MFILIWWPLPELTIPNAVKSVFDLSGFNLYGASNGSITIQVRLKNIIRFLLIRTDNKSADIILVIA
jgi:hypothetical protein